MKNIPKMRPTQLPGCSCTTRRIIIVDGILRCGECYTRYGKAGEYYYSDEFLDKLVTDADKNDKFYQAELMISNIRS